MFNKILINNEKKNDATRDSLWKGFSYIGHGDLNEAKTNKVAV